MAPVRPLRSVQLEADEFAGRDDTTDGCVRALPVKLPGNAEPAAGAAGAGRGAKHRSRRARTPRAVILGTCHVGEEEMDAESVELDTGGADLVVAIRRIWSRNESQKQKKLLESSQGYVACGGIPVA